MATMKSGYTNTPSGHWSPVSRTVVQAPDSVGHAPIGSAV